MFFKKKKTMTEQTFDKEPAGSEETENLAAGMNEAAEETIAKELNGDDSVPGTQHLDEDLSDDSELEQLKAQLAEAKDKYIRLMAEFENFRRRSSKERLELTQTAGKDIIQSLLVVLDDTDRAARQMESSTDLEQIKQGVSLVFNKLRSTLQQRGLKKMESVGQEFDADLHEAITEIPAPTEEMQGKVIDETEPGYYLNDKLIRHAKVIVGK